MINSLDEVNRRFDAIKDHKPKASKKLNELGEILSSAFLLDPEKASDMWQYLVDLNVKEDVKNAKFYIAQVYKKITGNLSLEDAARFISMVSERVQLMFLYGYDGESLYQCLNSMVEGFIKLDNIDNAYTIFEYFSEKFGGIDSDDEGFTRGVHLLCEGVRDFSRKNKNYKNNVQEFFEQLSKTNNSLVSGYARSMLILSGDFCIANRNEIFELLDDCIEGKYGDLFLEMEYFFRNEISSEEIVSTWENYCSNLGETEVAPKFNDFISEDDWYTHDTVVWFTNHLIKSKLLLEKYFDGTYSYSFLDEVIRIWILNEDWDSLAIYFSRALSGISQPVYFDMYWRFLSKYTHLYLAIYEETDDYRRSNKILNADNIDEFSETLVKISKMSLGSVCHERYDRVMLEFLEESIGDVKSENLFNKYGLSLKVHTDTHAFMKDSPSARDAGISSELIEYLYSYDKFNFRSDIPILNHIYQKAKTSYLGRESTLAYALALNKDLSNVLCKKWKWAYDIKSDMIFECIQHGNENRAIELVDLMLETESYPDYASLKDTNGQWMGYSWETEIKNVIVAIIKEVESNKPVSIKKDYISSEVTYEVMSNTVVYLAQKVLPHLSEGTAKEVRAALPLIAEDNSTMNQFIKDLMEDVKLYTTFPKPRGSWNAQQHNRITDEMLKGFATLSKKGRVEIISEILQMLFQVRDKLKPISFSMWMSHIACQVSSKTCVKLFKENQQIFRGWLENAERRDIVSWARRMGDGCSRSDYLQFTNMVEDVYGSIPELMDCYRLTGKS